MDIFIFLLSLKIKVGDLFLLTWRNYTPDKIWQTNIKLNKCILIILMNLIVTPIYIIFLLYLDELKQTSDKKKHLFITCDRINELIE